MDHVIAWARFLSPILNPMSFGIWLQVNWPFAIYTINELEVKLLRVIPSDIACWLEIQYFSNQGTPLLSCLADATGCLALPCLVLICLLWPNINQSHTCLWQLAILVVIDFHIVLQENYICAKFRLDIHIHWIKYVMLGIVKKTDKARRDKTRQERTRYPDKMFIGFETYCISGRFNIIIGILHFLKFIYVTIHSIL